ncbi:TetR/AcrR family transcriptional regulator [Priestia megaterium]|uniref:TetR/AcrR family transcriptional regulator n=1 Tax=Priestia megaterium TaxID=1404 RepID=UPI002E1EE13F|nr:TetR/AcrR family transcriptional regulator [Priestia megaterium]
MPKRLTMEEKKKQTIEMLLNSAEVVFSKKGYNGASVDEIAEEAGYSKGAVYSNFTNKENLFLALYDRRFNNQLEEWEKVFEKQLDNVNRAVQVEELLISHWKISQDSKWTLLMLEFTLYALRNEDTRQKLAIRYKQILDSMKEAISSHFNHDDMSSQKINEIVISLLSLETGLNILESIIPHLTTEGYRARIYREFL